MRINKKPPRWYQDGIRKRNGSPTMGDPEGKSLCVSQYADIKKSVRLPSASPYAIIITTFNVKSQ